MPDICDPTSGDQRRVRRALFAGLLHDLNADLAANEIEPSAARNTEEFTTAVRETVKTLVQASAGWDAMLNTIRNS
jgi:hypothetical protein